jgi:tRNA pseudouridine13 synthase
VARIRSEPEDFRVEEIPLYPPLGHGDHTFVSVEKRRRTTDDVANSLARLAGVKPRDVGYAGRKDREAVTTQWFSVPGLDPRRALEFASPGIRVVEAALHPHKLRTGQLRGNRFRIVVREIDPDVRSGALARFEALCRSGMPNRFGPQRFGRDGENVARAQQILRGEAPRIDRRTARFLISALQAAVFNAALHARDLPLDALECGDVAMVHESGGSFVVEDLAREAPRAAAFEISATGPIFGPRLLSPVGRPAEREQAALAQFARAPGRRGCARIRGYSRTELRAASGELRHGASRRGPGSGGGTPG